MIEAAILQNERRLAEEPSAVPVPREPSDYWAIDDPGDRYGTGSEEDTEPASSQTEGTLMSAMLPNTHRKKSSPLPAAELIFAAEDSINPAIHWEHWNVLSKGTHPPPPHTARPSQERVPVLLCRPANAGLHGPRPAVLLMHSTSSSKADPELRRLMRKYAAAPHSMVAVSFDLRYHGAMRSWVPVPDALPRCARIR